MRQPISNDGIECVLFLVDFIQLLSKLLFGALGGTLVE